VTQDGGGGVRVTTDELADQPVGLVDRHRNSLGRQAGGTLTSR
jgi:hypothetical protein